MATPATADAAPKTSARVRVQQFGTFLSNMVMPNIGAFIAWGLITALFIESGWLNLGGGERAVWGADSWVARIGGWGDFADGGIVGPMITYLLPILIAYTGGRMVYDARGGVVGAIAAMGVIAGAGIPMFMGAMIMGPLGGWSMKKLDALWTHRIRPGFEMLVNNFSAGIWGMILAFIGFFLISPVVEAFSNAAASVVNFLVQSQLLPLTSVFIEPAKILFLNNAINHGILTPIGTNQALVDGKSVLFLLEANPGPGLGVLLAFMFFGTGMAKGSAPGAILIHFLGGIHEIYFPYVLMKPKLLAAVILGGMTGVFVNVLFDVGLRAPAAPGSIIAIYLQTASDSYIGVTLSVLAATLVSFAVAAFLLKTDKSKDEGDLAAATADMEAMKGKKSSVAGSLTGAGSTGEHTGPIHQIVFACDAGMGSSAMGASVLRKKIQQAGHDDVTVVNKAISNLTDTYDLVVSHQDLTPRARQRTGSAMHVSVDNFMNSPRYDEIVDLLARTNSPADVTAGAATAGGASAAGASAAASTPSTTASTTTASEPSERSDKNSPLPLEAIVLGGRADSRDAAIEEAGGLLVGQGAVGPKYVEAMHDREASVSTYMGNMLAIPHGTNEAKGEVNRTGLSFVRYDEPIDWNGQPVRYVVGIAGVGDDHLAILSQLAGVFLDDKKVAVMDRATTPEEIHDLLSEVSL
ncbi:PTS mannitol transporter subunit IICBA [Mobilicoccus caccae]|uniref:Mannitol-specific phosphotransferase enzyme IIA component n=1 Tax=Mobilicoccus caccae TaxID=1859295 RepID=A0ABQ6IMD9_9MICO|nr:PTS mannitol transporter subunit IICBA [Mobilicoccus caccae]GMA39099.1 PTS mannose transporter subunit IIA [Mobilicoccus caccae]